MTDLRQQIKDQYQWIADHGGDQAGYVRRYGSAKDADHYGDGGEAIFMADEATLGRLLIQGVRAGLFKRGKS